jgi:hypothetical protein
MTSHADPIQTLIATFDGIQQLLAALRASKENHLNDLRREGVCAAKATADYDAALRRLQKTADQTSKDIRSLL